KKTIQLNENIILDFDAKDKHLGVEILNASKVIDKKVILEAEAIQCKAQQKPLPDFSQEIECGVSRVKSI
ncbi:MAG: DUF2283 domain-containing protein, partial [Nanoarchaeota archaeon]|nr:DUF2283 domain-containing protein [Nanoarchaeota archaeon]